jgi:hypothetical protein
MCPYNSGRKMSRKLQKRLVSVCRMVLLKIYRIQQLIGGQRRTPIQPSINWLVITLPGTLVFSSLFKLSKPRSKAVALQQRYTELDKRIIGEAWRIV